jgi:hypothetical protein
LKKIKKYYYKKSSGLKLKRKKISVLKTEKEIKKKNKFQFKN